MSNNPCVDDTSISFRCSLLLKRMLMKAAAEKHLTVTEVIVNAIEHRLERYRGLLNESDLMWIHEQQLENLSKREANLK